MSTGRIEILIAVKVMGKVRFVFTPCTLTPNKVWWTKHTDHSGSTEVQL